MRTISQDMKTTLLALLAMLCITFAASAADVSGKWTAEIPGRGGNTQTTTFNLTQSGDAVTGNVTTPQGDRPIENGKIDGDTLSFSQSVQGRDGNSVTIKYTGKVSADHIDFSRDAGRGNPVTFTAKKS